MNPLCDGEFVCPIGAYTAEQLEGELAHLLGPLEYTGKQVYGGDEVLDLIMQIWNIAYQAHRAGLPAAKSLERMFDDIILPKLTDFRQPEITHWGLENGSSSETEITTDSD